MSHEWVAAAYGAFERRDWGQIRELLDPDVEFRTTVEATSGHGGVENWIRQADELLDGFEIRVEEVIEAGDRVVVLVHERGRGRGSGVQIDHHLVHVWTLRDGRAVALESFVERDEAFAAAGLR